ncbi:hypothetical protein [Stenotrophomonas sp. SORGH_AS_0321]|uniref:hypothetical protein n=1 Tax=Stenotrophomonas sp. SORGH_AS_0321 TaxID=3041787 RepID=UPI00286C79F2|nr:hypothetical protein [Stenotrophomonas sp. SORGH_AS_0321]
MHTIALDIVPDFQGWVGLNSGLYLDNVTITPALGIHCAPLMRLCCALKEKPYKISESATFAYSLSTIKRDVEPFIFMSEEDVVRVAERLASTIAQCAPFMRDFASYEAIASISETRSAMLGGYPEQAAVALYLMGRADEARAWLAKQLERFSAMEPATSEPFERFATKLLHLIDTQGISALASGSSSSYLEQRWKYLREAFL